MKVFSMIIALIFIQVACSMKSTRRLARRNSMPKHKTHKRSTSVGSSRTGKSPRSNSHKRSMSSRRARPLETFQATLTVRPRSSEYMKWVKDSNAERKRAEKDIRIFATPNPAYNWTLDEIKKELTIGLEDKFKNCSIVIEPGRTLAAASAVVVTPPDRDSVAELEADATTVLGVYANVRARARAPDINQEPVNRFKGTRKLDVPIEFSYDKEPKWYKTSDGEIKQKYGYRATAKLTLLASNEKNYTFMMYRADSTGDDWILSAGRGKDLKKKPTKWKQTPMTYLGPAAVKNSNGTFQMNLDGNFLELKYNFQGRTPKFLGE